MALGVPPVHTVVSMPFSKSRQSGYLLLAHPATATGPSPPRAASEAPPSGAPLALPEPLWAVPLVCPAVAPVPLLVPVVAVLSPPVAPMLPELVPAVTPEAATPLAVVPVAEPAPE